MARFVNWLNQIYGLDFRRSFVKFYENVKTETPRALDTLNAYLEEYDLFDVLLYRGRPDITQSSGFYEVKKSAAGCAKPSISPTSIFSMNFRK